MMESDLLQKLQAVDPAVLADVVRQDQNSPSFEITQWSLRRLNAKGITNPEGLWLYSGTGRDKIGSRNWSVVLKILPRAENPVASTEMNNPERELLVIESGLTRGLPGRVRAPRFYRVDRGEKSDWLWMELVPGINASPLTVEQFGAVGEILGEWHGAYAAGSPTPEAPWLAEHHLRSWLSGFDLEQAWNFPLNQKHITPDQRKRCTRLWESRERLLRAVESLPVFFSHFDTQVRNFAIHPGPDGQDELVLIDWAQCGRGPLGAEFAWLIGVSSLMDFLPPPLLRPIDGAATAGYLRGLHKSGWQGDPFQVRFTICAAIGLFMGAIFPQAISIWCSEGMVQFALENMGCAGEELYLKWLPCFDFYLELGDEAFRLLTKIESI